MATGWNKLEEASSGETKVFLPRLVINAKNPGPKIVRFLEQQEAVNAFSVHAYTEPGQFGPMHKQFTCQEEFGRPCPGCAAGMKKKVRVVLNAIERNRDQLAKNTDGFAIKQNGEYVVSHQEDEVVVASVGQPTGNMLRELDAAYGGLMTRDWAIKFSGDKMQPWFIAPADPNATPEQNQASENDNLLYNTKRRNLTEVMEAESTAEKVAEICRKFVNNPAMSAGGQPQQGFQAPPQQPQTQFAQQQPVPQQAPPQVPAGGSGFAPAAAQAPAQAPAQQQGAWGEQPPAQPQPPQPVQPGPAAGFAPPAPAVQPPAAAPAPPQ